MCDRFVFIAVENINVKDISVPRLVSFFFCKLKFNQFSRTFKDKQTFLRLPAS